MQHRAALEQGAKPRRDLGHPRTGPRIDEAHLARRQERAEQIRDARGRAELGTGSILFFIPTIRATDWVESKRFKLDKNGKTESTDEAEPTPQASEDSEDLEEDPEEGP